MKKIHQLGCLWLLLAQGGCASNRDRPQVQSITVKAFQCENADIGEAVRNVVIGCLLQHGRARIAREGESELMIEGVVTVGNASAVRAGGSVFSGTSQAGGIYTSGASALVLRQGEIVGSAKWGQQLSGNVLLSPEIIGEKLGMELVRSLQPLGLRR